MRGLLVYAGEHCANLTSPDSCIFVGLTAAASDFECSRRPLTGLRVVLDCPKSLLGGAMIVGIGVDIVEIGRLRRTLGKQADRFLKRVFTAAEQEYCNAHRDPVPHYAARFAAKEAVFKALGTGWAQGVAWLDVEVRRREGGAPSLTLLGAAERHGLALGLRTAHLSLSHSDEAAVAMVILEN